MGNYDIEDIRPGSAVVIREASFCAQLGLCFGQVYRVGEVEIIPKKTLLSQDYIEVGIIPDQYKPYMIKGIETTNHDHMGSDRFLHINGRIFSAAWFRPATGEEVNRHNRSIL